MRLLLPGSVVESKRNPLTLRLRVVVSMADAPLCNVDVSKPMPMDDEPNKSDAAEPNDDDHRGIGNSSSRVRIIRG